MSYGMVNYQTLINIMNIFSYNLIILAKDLITHHSLR